MKKALTFLVLILVVIMCGCKGTTDRMVENPELAATNTRILKINRISTSDSLTTVEGVAEFYPGWWIIFNDNMYLQADGVKYKILGSDSLTLNDTIWMPESGKQPFVLKFEPVPAKVNAVDLIEPSEGGWQLLGIDLTGKADYVKSGMQSVPDELLDTELPDSIPAPALKCDSSTVRVHLLGYRPEMGNTLSYYLNSLTGQSAYQDGIKLDENGVGEASFKQYGPVEFMVRNENGFQVPAGYFLVEPGETVDLYLNTNWYAWYLRNDAAGTMPETTPVFAWNNSHNRNLTAMRKNVTQTVFWKQSDKFRRYDLDADAYTDSLIGIFRHAKDSINGLAVSEVEREQMLLALESELLANAALAERNAKIAYYTSHGDLQWGSPIPEGAIKLKMTPAQLRRAAAEVRDVNSPKILFAIDAVSCDDLTSPLWAEALGENSLLAELSHYNDQYVDACSGKTEYDGQFDGYTRPFFSEALKQRVADSKAEMSRLDLSIISPTPAVDDDKIFDAIVAPYKGKVVMVDLWNTWCGPCRAALKLNEPAKSGELASNDIVWIYIADESSPIGTYGKMIPDIKGLHYRLTSEQIAKIRQRFNVDGIPFYILVDRQGNAQGRPDLRDHSLFKKTLLEEVAR